MGFVVCSGDFVTQTDMRARKRQLQITYEYLSYPSGDELIEQARQVLERLQRNAGKTESVVRSDEIGDTNTPNTNILHP